MDAIRKMREAFAGQFMQPACYRGADIEEAIIESGMDYEENGIYCRLSADGYMDCTDWHGPFATIEQAAECLIETYAD
jgi:hypothetical protein